MTFPPMFDRSPADQSFPSRRPLRLAAVALAALVLGGVGPAHAQVTLNVVNNFSSALGADYFGGHVEDEDVYLYFTGNGVGGITFNSGVGTVTAGDAIQLSTVIDGTFSMPTNVSGARLYAVLGSSAPSDIPVSGPDSVTVTYPYSYIEFTTAPNGKGDQSFINQVSFPTTFSNGSQTNSFSPSATASSITSAFNAAFPTAPFAPAAGVAPGSGTPYDPYFATTVTRSTGTPVTPISGRRVIGPSNANNPNASTPPDPAGTGYTNAPGFNDYLGWLQTNDPGGGWDIAYSSGVTGTGTIYVGKLSVTGTDGNYGLALSGFTYDGVLNADGTMTGGNSVDGVITYAPNNSDLSVFGVPDYTGNWTDLNIFTAGPGVPGAVTMTGNLGSLNTSSVMYTVSAAIGAGILGSDLYITNDSNTNFFFQTGFTPDNALTDFFSSSTFDGSSQTGFYDQYWYTMLQAGGLHDGIYAGYFTPYDDHFNNLGVQILTDSGTLTWELGTVPEPSTIVLLGIGLGTVLFKARRRSRI